jgi:hypothetical protein
MRLKKTKTSGFGVSQKPKKLDENSEKRKNRTRIKKKIPQRLLDLCIKFFQEFVTWKISQSERKPEPVESALSPAAELMTHGPIQGSTGYYSLNSYRNLGKTHARVMNVNSFSGLQFYKI